MGLNHPLRNGKMHGYSASYEVPLSTRPRVIRVIWIGLVVLTLSSHIAPDGVRPLPVPHLQSAPATSPALPTPPLPIRSHAPATVANTEFETRIWLLESLILGLANNRPLDELRFEIVALYPELKPDFQPNWMSQHSNQIRAAAHRYRLRLELINVVLSEYAGLSISDSDSE